MLDLYDKLRRYGESDVYPFHMPGHKRGGAVSMEDPYRLDITEIDGFDDLNHPEEFFREAMEEAGLRLEHLRLRGILTFILPDWGNEMTFLYTAQTDTSELPECREGVLRWIPFGEIPALNLWEGDRVFLPLLQTRDDCFSLKLIYEPGGRLADWILDGNRA